MSASLTALFTEWVSKQDADAEYDFRNWHVCAATQFAESMGASDPKRMFNRLPDDVRIALAHSDTFGQLASRLAKRRGK